MEEVGKSQRRLDLMVWRSFIQVAKSWGSILRVLLNDVKMKAGEGRESWERVGGEWSCGVEETR